MVDEVQFREATGILKLVALGAHVVRDLHVLFGHADEPPIASPSQYPLCYPSWLDYIPTRRPKPPTLVRHYASDLPVVAPAPAAPAILSYLTLANKLSASWESINYVKPLGPTLASSVEPRSSKEWDGDWARILSVGDAKVAMGDSLTEAFRPGSLEGVWEGLFTVRLASLVHTHPRASTCDPCICSTLSSQRTLRFFPARPQRLCNAPSSHSTDRRGNCANIMFMTTMTQPAARFPRSRPPHPRRSRLPRRPARPMSPSAPVTLHADTYPMARRSASRKATWRSWSQDARNVSYTTASQVSPKEKRWAAESRTCL